MKKDIIEKDDTIRKDIEKRDNNLKTLLIENYKIEAILEATRAYIADLNFRVKSLIVEKNKVVIKEVEMKNFLK